MFWLWFFLISIASIGLVFAASLAEGAWWALKIEEVVAHESRRGGSSASTSLTKEMLRERMITVNWTLLVLDVFLFAGPFLLGFLVAEDKSAAKIMAASLIYPISRFFLGEVISKNLGYNHRLQVCLFTVHILFLISRILSPITWCLRKLDKMTGGRKRVIGEEDVVAVVKAAAEHGTVDLTGVELVSSVFSVGNKKVGELMTPLDNCRKIISKTTLRLFIDAMKDEEERPIIVLDSKNSKNVLGVLSSDDAIDIMTRQTGEHLNLSVAALGTVRLRLTDRVSKIFPELRKNPVGLIIGANSEEVVGVITLRKVLSELARAEEFE